MGVAKYVKNEKDAIEEVIYQSGISVKPVYTPRDLDDTGFDYEKDHAKYPEMIMLYFLHSARALSATSRSVILLKSYFKRDRVRSIPVR